MGKIKKILKLLLIVFTIIQLLYIGLILFHYIFHYGESADLSYGIDEFIIVILLATPINFIYALFITMFLFSFYLIILKIYSKKITNDQKISN